jgi:hypothetical protein
LPGHLVATGCYDDLGALLGRVTLHLQALFILVGQALDVIMLPHLGLVEAGHAPRLRTMRVHLSAQYSRML